ncbi:MAG: lysophospholipid acyltransferase family protein [Tepidisphaeraceae bacterium]
MSPCPARNDLPPQPQPQVQDRWRRRFFDRPENRTLWLRLFQAVDVTFCRIYHRLQLYSPCPVPLDGPAILACNHASGLDPPLLQSVVPRLIHFMADQELNDVPVANWVLRKLQSIPVPRTGGGASAIRAALRMLEQGELLGLFPEGRIEYDRALLPFQTGVALLAIKGNAPVYPVYLDGTQRNTPSLLTAYFKPNRAVIAFGPPVQFDRGSVHKDALLAATSAIQSAVQRLMDEVVGSGAVAIRMSRPHGRVDLFRRGSIARRSARPARPTANVNGDS